MTDTQQIILGLTVLVVGTLAVAIYALFKETMAIKKAAYYNTKSMSTFMTVVSDKLDLGVRIVEGTVNGDGTTSIEGE